MVDDRPEFDESDSSREDRASDASPESTSIRFDAEQSNQDRIHLLRIELRRIRSQASVARLEAQEAELELEIARLSNEPHSGPSATPVTGYEHSTDTDPGIESTETRFQSWDEVRETQLRNRAGTQHAGKHLRFDAASKSKHHLDRHPPVESGGVDQSDSSATADTSDDVETMSLATDDESPGADVPKEVTPQASDDEPAFAGLADAKSLDAESTAAFADVAVDGDQSAPDRSTKKSRPKAMIISFAVHAAVIIILAGWTLSSQKPKDQVSITASAATASEVSMETFSLETSEPEVDPTEPTESETEYDLSPIGEIAVAEFSLDTAPAPPSPMAASMLSSSAAASAAAMTLDTLSDAKIQFCGVEGGGNHFVYLVDSSGSMGNGFDSARKELLNSIDFLKSDQRFYVIFFDANPDFMRLSNSTQDEPGSVEATPGNKLALRRWAMRIAQDRGKNPYEVLEFALTLKPDVIFLLSDGEFPQRIEDLLKEKNHVENLFGDSGPMCIVHTIAYYSEEGESRMRRIAQQNGGQYRYVPKP